MNLHGCLAVSRALQIRPPQARAFPGLRAPPGLAATTQGLFMALPMGLATMIAFAASGQLYQAFGGAGFWAMTALALTGSLACLRLRR